MLANEEKKKPAAHREADRTDRAARLCMAERGPGLQTKTKEDGKIKTKVAVEARNERRQPPH